MSNGTEALALSYERSVDRPVRPRPGWYRVAMACGLVPFSLGTTIFLGWILSEWELLVIGGIFTILSGCLLFPVGAIFLTLYVRNQRRIPDLSRRHLHRRATVAAVVLLMNFPIAFVYADMAYWLYTRFVITVVNTSTRPIDSFSVRGGGVQDTDLGKLAPGESKKHAVHFDRDGTFKYALDWNGQKSSGDLEGYVTNGMGGAVSVDVTDGGVRVTKTK